MRNNETVHRNYVAVSLCIWFYMRTRIHHEIRLLSDISKRCGPELLMDSRIRLPNPNARKAAVLIPLYELLLRLLALALTISWIVLVQM